jgi:hypothetical protein
VKTILFPKEDINIPMVVGFTIFPTLFTSLWDVKASISSLHLSHYNLATETYYFQDNVFLFIKKNMCPNKIKCNLKPHIH